MLSTVLIVLAVVAAVGLLVAAGVAVVARRPSLVTRLARLGPARRLMVRATRAQIRRARRRGDVPAGATDLEIVLAGETGAEARAAKAMLARMNPRQRAEFSRRTLGADGLAALMETAATADGDDAGPGRADRRRVAGAAPAARSAQRRKAVAKRRAARKAGRGR